MKDIFECNNCSSEYTLVWHDKSTYYDNDPDNDEEEDVCLDPEYCPFCGKSLEEEGYE